LVPVALSALGGDEALVKVTLQGSGITLMGGTKTTATGHLNGADIQRGEELSSVREGGGRTQAAASPHFSWSNAATANLFGHHTTQPGAPKRPGATSRSLLLSLKILRSTFIFVDQAAVTRQRLDMVAQLMRQRFPSFFLPIELGITL
jgi:hypothetical protein